MVDLSMYPPETAITYFIWGSEIDISQLKKIIEANPALVNYCEPEWRRTSLDRAIAINNTEMIEYLLGMGALVTPEMFKTVCCNGNMEYMQLFIDYGVNINKNGYNDCLYNACRHGHSQLVRKLIDLGADINSKDLNLTPLHGAIIYGSKEIVEFLLERGADPSIKYRDFRLGKITSFQLAACVPIVREHPEIVGILRRYSNLKIPVHNLSTVNETIHNAVESGDESDVLRFLLKGGDVNQKDSKNLSPIFYAVMTNNTRMIELLVGEGALINSTDGNGNTPLDYAKSIEDGSTHKPMTEYLLSIDVFHES